MTASLLFSPGVTASWAQVEHRERGHGMDLPIQLAYVCGTRFLVTSTHSTPLTLAYRVANTREKGTVELQALPESNPEISESLIETTRAGAVELYLKGRKIAVRDNGRVPCTEPTSEPMLRAAAASAAAPAAEGAWSTPFFWPVVAVHLHLLPNRQVLSWGLRGQPHLWTQSSNTFTMVSATDELFCAGHTYLPDGRLLVVGGHIDNRLGLPDVNLFRAGSGAGAGWSDGGVEMARGRWYPTATTMGNGQAVILAGTDESGANVPVPEVWNGGLTSLPGASRAFPYYPRAFLAPNGRLFYAGEQATSRYLNTTGAGSWTTVDTREVANRSYGSAVMYEPGMVLYAGGGFTTSSAEVIDLNASAPRWTPTSPMAFARRHHVLTILPTGEVLATGGVAGTIFNDLSRPVLAAELWNPDTGMWKTLASSAVVRGYHNNSILLPDGRVLNSGSGDGQGAPRQLNAQLFSPPYLFAGPRPTIGSAPGVLHYGTSFQVATPNAASIEKVSLIRLGSATHAFDANQRYISLPFTPGSGALTVQMPNEPNSAPPGHYMLFILNGSDVPSVARIVQVL